ncbi:MAG: 1-acyl-sn-glycerol-3-phosphate acyltransferase [Oscillospiraceae bacterium]|nr:1-acyl-sn-glycerol-3-phosphate acyltransferase [Oscillospiraceae bacterium]
MRKKVKKPNGILYFLVYIFIYPFLKIMFRLKVDRTNYRPPKGPFIVLSNHTSFMDFLLTMLTIYPLRLNAVAAQKFFLYKPLNKLLPLMGCIPKNLFDPDIRSVIGIKSVIKRGGRILLFPEGRCTVDGPYMGMDKTTGILIKSLGVPVISCHIDGAYTCMPFWRKGIRFGRERVTLANLFTAEDMESMSADEINAAIDRSLSGMNTPAPSKPLRVFKEKRLLEGLQNIIYYCPKCGREFTLETKGNTIYCTACGNTATMDCYAKLIPTQGSIIPKSVHDWYKEQAVYEMQFLKEDMEPIKVQVTVRMPLKEANGIEPCGNGTLWLDPKGWHYDGQLLSEEVHLFFPIEMVPAMPFDPNDNFQIYSNGSFYSFTSENACACAKYATIGECAYWRFAPAVQMTPGYDSGFCINAILNSTKI